MFAAASGRVRFDALVLGVGLGSYFMYAFFIFILYIRIERQGCVTFASGLRWRLAPKAGGHRVLSVGFASGMRSGYAKVMVSLFSGSSGSHFLKSL